MCSLVFTASVPLSCSHCEVADTNVLFPLFSLRAEPCYSNRMSDLHAPPIVHLSNRKFLVCIPLFLPRCLMMCRPYGSPSFARPFVTVPDHMWVPQHIDPITCGSAELYICLRRSCRVLSVHSRNQILYPSLFQLNRLSGRPTGLRK